MTPTRPTTPSMRAGLGPELARERAADEAADERPGLARDRQAPVDGRELRLRRQLDDAEQGRRTSRGRSGRGRSRRG